MKRIKKPAYMILILSIIFAVSGCAQYERYETKVVPFKLPGAYPNAVEAAGASIAATAYQDPEKAKEAFGFDIIGAGVLPVQVVFDNKGSHPLEILSDKTYLGDSADNLWPVLDAGLAYDRIAKKTELGEVMPEAAKQGMLGAAAGAVIGSAIGIVTGSNVGEAAAKGAAVGAAAGVTMGGAKGLSDEQVKEKIGEDLRHRSLSRTPVPPREIAHGFIFFPSEATTALRELRLGIKETDTGTVHNLILKF